MAGSERQLKQGRAPSLLTMASLYADQRASAREDVKESIAAVNAGEARDARPTVAPQPVMEAPRQQYQPEPQPQFYAQPEPALDQSVSEIRTSIAHELLAKPVIAPETPTVRSRLASPLALALAGALAGAAIALAWPQSYVATSELLIEQGGVDNQLRMLRSGSTLSAVADKLNLAADPEFNGAPNGILALFTGDDAADQRRRRAITSLGRSLSVEQSGNSSVITVSAKTADPQKSALIANTVAAIFVEKNGGQVTDEARLTELRDAVAQAERAVEAFKARHELIDAQGTLITDEEIQRLGEQLSAARARTVELNARAASTRDANVDSIVTGSLPEQVASPTLTELRARYAAARQQLDRLRVKLGPRHPERLAAEAEVEAARQEISAELRRVASSLQTELKRAVEQEQQLAAKLAQMKVRQGNIGDELVELRELERQAAVKRSAYEQALQATQPGAAPDGAPSIISQAEPPLNSSSPSVPHLAGAGGLAGLLFGFGFSSLRRRRREEVAAGSDASATEHQEIPEYSDLYAQDTGKDPATMYAYPHHQHPAAQQQHPAQTAHAAAPAVPQPYPAPGYPQMQAAPMYPAPMPPMQPQMMPQPMHPQPVPAWPYPQPAQHPYAAMPMPQMPMPYDPWAAMRGWAQMVPPPQPQPMPQVIVVQVPQPVQPQAAALPAPQVIHAVPQHVSTYTPQHPQAANESRWTDQDAYVDERTDAAIDEIRRSLREFREAIEDFADERSVYNPKHRRFGS